jgi:hypothetical protein
MAWLISSLAPSRAVCNTSWNDVMYASVVQDKVNSKILGDTGLLSWARPSRIDLRLEE